MSALIGLRSIEARPERVPVRRWDRPLRGLDPDPAALEQFGRMRPDHLDPVGRGACGLDAGRGNRVTCSRFLGAGCRTFCGHAEARRVVYTAARILGPVGGQGIGEGSQ